MTHIYITSQHPSEMSRSDGKFYVMCDNSRLSPDEFESCDDAYDCCAEAEEKGYHACDLWIARCEDGQYVYVDSYRD